MLTIFLIITFLISTIISIPQTEFIPALIKNLYINNCIIIKNQTNITNFDISFTKYLSKHNIQTVYMNFYEMNATMYQDHFLKNHKRRVFVIIDTQTINNDLLRIFNTDNEHFLQDYVWTIFDLDEISFEKIENIYIPYNCQFLNIKNINGSTFEIFEIYHMLVLPRDLYKIFYGVWKEDEGLKIINRDFYGRRFDMNRTIFPVETYYLPEDCDHPAICVYGEIVRDMGKMMNFRPFFMSSDTYNEIWENNTNYPWEFSLGLYVFHSASYVSDMIAPIWKTPAFLHIAYNEAFEQGYTSPHTRPFSMNVWITIVAWILLSGLCIFCINYFLHKTNKKQFTALINHAFLPLDSFTNQCGTKLPKSISARIAASMTRLAPFYIVPVYSAAVLSFVTVKLIDLPFRDLRGLVEQGSFKIGYENGTFLHVFFHKSNDPVTLIALEKFIVDLDEMPQTPDEGIKKMCEDPKFAFLFFNNDIYGMEMPCKIMQIRTPILITWDGFNLRYNSPYKKIFNRILKTFFSAGVLKKMGKIAYGRKPRKEKDEQPDPVKLRSVRPLLIVTYSIYALTLIILLAECIYYRKRKSEVADKFLLTRKVWLQ